MRLQFRLNLRHLVLALIALLSLGAILLKQSDIYLRASAAAQTIVSVNAANYQAGALARGSLASIFGNNLAARSEKSEIEPPPPTLGGARGQAVDSAVVEHAAGLVMASPGQINYVIPDKVPPGAAKVVVKNEAGIIIAEGALDVVDSSPALFSSGSDKSNLAVGMISAGGSGTQGILNSDGS